MSRSLYWLSDEAWAAIAPHLPQNQPGARRVDDRRVLGRKRPIRHDRQRYRDRWRIEQPSAGSRISEGSQPATTNWPPTT